MYLQLFRCGAPKHLDIFKGAPRRLPKPLSDQFPVRVSLLYIHRLHRLCRLYTHTINNVLYATYICIQFICVNGSSFVVMDRVKDNRANPWFTFSRSEYWTLESRISSAHGAPLIVRDDQKGKVGGGSC